jgi:predicted nucleotidyltransferase
MMRKKILQSMIEELRKHEQVLGCYEAGSVAFDRNDEWSDIDFQVVVKDDFVEQAVKILEEALQSIAEFETRFILPPPTWHGHWQGFYQLKGISPYLMIDAVIMKESSPSYFTETELHGTPNVFFDKTGRIGKEHINRDELQETILKRLQRVESMKKLNPVFVDKEIQRGRETDAFEMYYNLLFRTMVEQLRIKYDPARWSWGPKYLCHILPEDVYNKVKSFSLVKDMQDPADKKEAVCILFNKLLQENLKHYANYS